MPAASCGVVARSDACLYTLFLHPLEIMHRSPLATELCRKVPRLVVLQVETVAAEAEQLPQRPVGCYQI